VSGEPYPKSGQLARGPKRAGRRKATKVEWARIVKAKTGPCRVCVNVNTNGHDLGLIEFHHIVPRSQGGDDIEDNIAPLHSWCHGLVTLRERGPLAALAASLTEPERAYCIGKLGEGALDRLFGVGGEPT
jgi:5-methylcytosine-specific restriction endonuclease McrA